MFANPIYNINYNNIIILDPIKNSMLEESLFYKFLYSNENVTFNGIFFLFNLENVIINKDRINFNSDNINNKSTLDKIIEIEKTIFDISNTKKKKNYKIKDIIVNNNIKFNKSDVDDIENYEEFNDFTNNKHTFILKLSGFWETKENIGITFKIIKINKYLDLLNI